MTGRYFIIAILLNLAASEQQKVFNISESASEGQLIGYINGTASYGIWPNYLVVFSDDNKNTKNFISVNEISGEITVRSKLDHEIESFYDFVVVPLNGTEKSTHVYINVIDENDNSPKFPVSIISLEISEYARLHSEISIPAAIDRDSALFSVQKYRIRSGNVNNAFRLSTKKVNSVVYLDLVVNGELDREYRDHYDLIIEALDGGKPPKIGTLRANITILDANDNSPEFSEPRYTAEVPWNVTVGYKVITVHATDPDLGLNSLVSYSVVQTRPEMKSHFAIDSKTGVVSVTDASFEPGSVHELLIIASDHGLPQPLETTSFLTVIISKSTEPTPQFDIFWLTDSGAAEIYENTTVGYVLARVAVQNVKADSEITLKGCDSICLEQTQKENVYLALACNHLFDREYKSAYNINFLIKNNDAVVLEHPVVLEVLDINDNAPQFGESVLRVVYNRSADEDNVVRVIATDADVGENARIRYTIWETDVFSIEPDTGILHLKQHFGCPNGEIQFRVKAEDNGIPSLSTTVDVIADIIERGERAPVFSKPLYEVNVREDIEIGTCLIEVSARKTCGSLSGLRYSLRESSSSQAFSIDEQRGKICVIGPLDYEKTNKYQLTVIAHDQSGQTGYSLVNFHIQDVNDNSPFFSPLDYNVSVREDIAAGTPVVVLSAKDADQEAYGQIAFRIADGAYDDFYIDSSSGQLYIKRTLTRQSYEILVQAKDGGGLFSDQNARVHVTVVSLTAPVPQFTSNLYEFVISEDVLPGIAIGNIEATGPFPIKYSIYSGDPNRLFTVESKTGRILVARMLDADKWRSVLLNVQARMVGGDANYSQVLVNMTDVNDNDPLFAMDRIEVNVAEDFAKHTPFFAVQATDADFEKNGEITYFLVSSHPPCPISVRPLTGELTLSSSLDYEAIRNYELVIRAKDHGIPPRSSDIIVIVNIIDVNDNPPVFEAQQFEIKVPEDIQIMTEVLTTKAVDADSGDNARIRYTLFGENADFGIHASSGHIFVKNPLDRERKSMYRYIITATDYGQPQLSTNVSLEVIVLDINDNSPKCVNSSGLIFNDNTEVGEIFGNVRAIDLDDGENGTVIYRLQNSDANFAVNDKGEVSMKRKIPQVEFIKDYRLSVIASDRGPEARSTVCQLKIAFQEMQSRVVFHEPLNRYIRIFENCLKKCKILTLNASNVHKWEIQSNDIASFFRIEYNALWTSDEFDASYFVKNRRLTIAAYDFEGRKRSTTFFIRPILTVLQGNRSTATFIRLDRSTLIGTKIATIGREERDVFWNLMNKTNDFVLHEASSSLYLSSNLMDTDETSFTLNIMRTVPPDYISEKYTIFIEIQPENVHNPEFDNCHMTLTVPEDIIVGSQIAQVHAIDYDDGPDGEVSYRLLRNEDMFSIDSATGDLFVNRALNWSIASKMFIVVEAEDHAADPKHKKKSNCVIFIEINDTNNNSPFFLSDSNVNIGEDGCVSGVIHHVVAKDVDQGERGRVTYSIVDGSKNNVFAIDETTGALSVNDCLTETVTLLIQASDQGEKPNVAEQNLTIFVAPNQNFWKYFDSKHYRFFISADSRIGTLVHEFDLKAQDLREIKLFPNFVSVADVFEMTDTGKLKVISALTESSYDFIVVAESYANQSDWANVHIEIPSNIPLLPRIASTSCGNLTVRENVAIPNLARIFTITNQSSEKLEYKIVAGNERNSFTIDPITGLISCMALDREYKSEHFLVIVVEKQGILTQADTCTLRVKVSDENDNTPNITRIVPDYIEITDDTKLGSIVAKVDVVDEDEGENGQVYFSLIEDESGLFDITSESGEIIFARDLRTTQHEILLKIRAENRGFSLPLFDDAVIRVYIRRKKPEFPHEPSFLSQRYTGHVFEGVSKGEVVLRISSTDRMFADAPLAYSIVSGNVDNVFEIDDSGAIITKQELDREILAEYNLKIIGYGDYKTSPETNVYIRVLNVNDNAPLIGRMRPYRVSESTPIGTAIAKVVATDVDVDSHIEYSIARNKYFDINRFSGVIHLKAQLDYESVTRHELKIQAYDGEHSSTGTFIVEVLDENDNAPQFEKSFYDIIVGKDLPVGSQVAVITAKDLDAGVNGKLLYNFSKHSSMFELDMNNGAIRNTVNLSFITAYYLRVQAFDHGYPPLSTATTVRIRVVNNALSLLPSFEKNLYSFNLPEDLSPYVVFGYVKVSGSSGTVTDYRIVASQNGSFFHVNSNGALALKRPLDREKQTVYQFSIEAFSKYSLGSATTTVEVHLIDLNDNAPMFAPHPGKVLVSENMKPNDVLMRFTASDLDADSIVSYELLAGNDFGMFRLDGISGVLYFVRWSEEALRQQKKFSDLVVAAVDSGKPPKWNVTIVSVVFDVDAWSGSAPFFIVPYYQKSVFENLSVGEVVLRPRAVSRIGIHGDTWEYSLKDNDELFFCNRSTGDIMIRGTLDYETRTAYEFSLIVRDRSSRSAVVPVRMRVLGVDEHAPAFAKKSFIFKIPNTARAGERVGIVTATDRDSGIDGIVRYHFENKNVSHLFIDSETGQIFLERDLGGYNRTIEEVTVIASSGILQSKAKVIIEISDIAAALGDGTVGSLSGTSLVTVVSVLLLTFLMLAVAFLVFKMRHNMREQEKPSKQVYSVSHGSVAVMADIHRSSPKFCYEIQRMPLPTPPNARLQTPLSVEESGYSEGSVRMRVKSVNEQLRNVENEIIGRSMPRSMPDSGIEPDEVSLASSVTDYLTQIGVTHNQIFDRNVDESHKFRLTSTLCSTPYDPELNELIYAKVDEILSPASRINSSLTSISLNVPSLTQSPFKLNPMPSLRPLTEILSYNNRNS